MWSEPPGTGVDVDFLDSNEGYVHWVANNRHFFAATFCPEQLWLVPWSWYKFWDNMALTLKVSNQNSEHTCYPSAFYFTYWEAITSPKKLKNLGKK